MRLNKLNLLKYGKFSDQPINMPVSKQDFHLIVGPNEAGKSTVRSSILDLLFGIPNRSPLGFLHPLSELCLTGHVEKKDDSLEFQRVKAQKQTLRSLTGTPLADTALSSYLGSADRTFFEQMFAIDHGKLVEGGNNILKADDDLGQMLFQSAAGVASLGKVRDSLAKEAEGLWDARRSGSRQYYIASDRLDTATEVLKKSIVRTKEWSEANDRVEDLKNNLKTASDRDRVLQAKRTSLERVRRTAPFLRTMREAEARLIEIGSVPALPVDAEIQFSNAKRDSIAAQSVLNIHVATIEDIKSKLSSISVDEKFLSAAQEIESLNELRVQNSAHSNDIQKREAEIEFIWNNIKHICGQLGWDEETERSLAQKIPSLIVRQEIAQLIREKSVLSQELKSSETTQLNKQSEVDALNAELERLLIPDIKPALRAALSDARLIGDAATTIQKLEDTVSKARASLDFSLASLGRWTRSVENLHIMQIPDQQLLSDIIRKHLSLNSDRESILKRILECKTSATRIELEIKQYKELHQPVTLESVVEARASRNKSWLNIKDAKVPIEIAAADYESLVENADKLVDTRFSGIENATKLQNFMHNLEREKLNLHGFENDQIKLDQDIQSLDVQWKTLIEKLDLTEMSLSEIPAWLAKREQALSLSKIYEDSEKSLNQENEAISNACIKLAKALRDADVSISDEKNLSYLSVEAEDFIKNVDALRIRKETLLEKLATAQPLIALLAQNTISAKRALDDCEEKWSAAVNSMRLTNITAPGAVEGALELISRIDDDLQKIQEIRSQRIDTMNSDLKKFADQATRLADKVAQNIKFLEPSLISQELSKSLVEYQKSQNELERLTQSLNIEQEKYRQAEISIQAAASIVKPLMDIACVDTPEMLTRAINISNEYSLINKELIEARKFFLESGDGLLREQLEAEISAHDLSQLPSDLIMIEKEISEINQQQQVLAAKHADAFRTLSEISGSDSAAMAETERQEAISEMAEVAERFIKVFTAEKLLRWSINRYREDKQGPMLKRTGEIFSRLTLDSFQKLVVDFDQQPVALEGQRKDGKTVSILGMSDGTRDQLFLALRLAALELHMAQASPLPFIADDLFINYDEERSKAGLQAMAALSEKTQVIFLTHHNYMIQDVQDIFGQSVNIVRL